MSEDRNKNSAVKIVPYDNEMPEMFEAIKKFLYNKIPHQIKVEHIGSTAVEGLGGKRVIDVLIITKKELMRNIVGSLELIGYKFNPEAGEGTFPERFFISGPFFYNEMELHVHFHVTFTGSKEHEEKLLFRDYLRRHPSEAEVYYRHKKNWSMNEGSDKRKYTEFKTEYINEILEKAKKEISDGNMNKP